MVPIVFFGLLCLGPYAVTGDDLNWVPNFVPWPAEQCIQKGFIGECDISRNVNNSDPYYNLISPCRSLKCARPKPKRGLGPAPPGYDLIRTGRPADGTLVGILKACYKGSIVDITPDRIPTQTGSSARYYCTSSRIGTKKTADIKPKDSPRKM